MKIKKLIAPVAITLLLVLYFLGVAALFFWLEMALWIRLLALLIGLALAGVSIFVLIERIEEIRSGEEDDLSQY